MPAEDEEVTDVESFFEKLLHILEETNRDSAALVQGTAIVPLVYTT